MSWQVNWHNICKLKIWLDYLEGNYGKKFVKIFWIWHHKWLVCDMDAWMQQAFKQAALLLTNIHIKYWSPPFRGHSGGGQLDHSHANLEHWLLVNNRYTGDSFLLSHVINTMNIKQTIQVIKQGKFNKTNVQRSLNKTTKSHDNHEQHDAKLDQYYSSNDLKKFNEIFYNAWSLSPRQYMKHIIINPLSFHKTIVLFHVRYTKFVFMF